MPLTKEQRNIVIEALKEYGTYIAGAHKAQCSIEALRKERKFSPKFQQQCNDALAVGRTQVGESALMNIMKIANDPKENSKIKLTANMALANAFFPGFKGITQAQVKHQHSVEVITGIPRPEYIEGEYQLAGANMKQLPPVDKKRLSWNAYMRDYRSKKRQEKKLANMNKKIAAHPING